jgi:general secretion pathway protein M
MAVDAVRAFWNARNSRERRILAIAGGILLAAILYVVLIEPVLNARARLEKQLPMARAEVRLLRAQVAEIERLRASVPAAPQGALTSRVGVIASQLGARDAFQEISALPDGRVRVVARTIQTRVWLDWLKRIEDSGARIEHCRVTPLEPIGEVNVELILGTTR